MFNKSLLLALAASTLVTAQTHTDCDPRKKSECHRRTDGKEGSREQG